MVRLFLLSAAVLVLGDACARGQGKEPSPAELVKRLSSEGFAQREKAARALEALGAAALPALAEALKSADLETSRRARQVQQRIEDKLAAATVMTPKLHPLKLVNVRVAEAIAQLEMRTGLEIRLDPAVPKEVREKLITLELGAQSTWALVHALTQRSGLTESTRTPFALKPFHETLGSWSPARQAYIGGEPLRLGAGAAPSVPWCESGPLRFRLLPPRHGEEGQASHYLEIRCAPPHQLQTVEAFRIVEATDVAGKAAAVPTLLLGAGQAPREIEWLRSKDGLALPCLILPLDRPAGSKAAYQRLRGHVTARFLCRSTALATPDLKRSLGKTLTHVGGASLKIVELEQTDDGDLYVRLSLRDFEPLVQDHPGPKVVRRPGFVALRGPADFALDSIELHDALGPLPRLSAQHQLLADKSLDVQLTFQAPARLDQPLLLSFASYRAVSVDVPFVLSDLPQP